MATKIHQSEARNDVSREFIVREFMSKNVLTVDSSSMVSKAIKIMVDNEIGGVVVLEGERLRGLFTERDLLRVLVQNKNPESTAIKDVMSPAASRIAPNQRSLDAARLMTDTRNRMLVFEGEMMVGIVTATDMVKVIYRTGILFDIGDVVSKKVVTTEMNTRLKFVIREMEAKGVGSIILTENKAPRSIFTERDLLNRVLFLELGLDTPVVEVATFPLTMAELGINGREAAGAMIARRIKRLPLTKLGKMVGMVTARDLVQAYAYPSGMRDSEAVAQFRVRYGELCPLCNTRIDDRGLCACGAGGA